MKRLALVGAAACSRITAPTTVPQDSAAEVNAVVTDITRAEDVRSARDVPPEAQRNRDPAVRRLAARAFARILDRDDTALLRALEDDDSESVAWAGYGLGESCEGREDSHVRALSTRLVSLEPARVSGRLNACATILRALGRCGGDRAEQTLRAWLRQAAVTPQPDLDEAAAYAFGDLATKRGSLSTESALTLLDAVQREPPLDAALYAFGRIEVSAPAELEPQTIAAARAAMGRPGPARIFALRALGRSTRASVAADLAGALSSVGFTAAERAESARALGHLHEAGQAALARALVAMLRGGPPTIDGEPFGVLLAAVRALGDDLPKDAAAALWKMARAEFEPGGGAAVARRASALRCAAAQKLARGAWNSDILLGCDIADGEAGERARLAAVDRGPLVRMRRDAWLELVRQTRHVRVREAAVDAIVHHPELGEAARAALAEALGSSTPGVVATAANVVVAHPERVYVLAEREKRAALEPRVPFLTTNPSREVDRRIAAALRAAIAHPWTQDLVETRAALIEAALAVGLDEGRAYAHAACGEATAALRSRASRALAAAGDGCSEPTAPADPAPEIDHRIAGLTRVTFDTDAGGALSVSFDPAFAPVASTRFVALARSGFYTGIAVHRVVAGFAVQLGDPGGDGYGGAGTLLRCETSPVPFGALDVGVALSGRDTGSSQFFVALARQPQLDGQYAWVGRAFGDWNAVAEGDVVQAVRVEE